MERMQSPRRHPMPDCLGPVPEREQLSAGDHAMLPFRQGPEPPSSMIVFWGYDPIK
jgi:hypothetical protein